MFPQITKNPKKKANLYGTQQMRKEWEQLHKDLDFKAKNVAKKLPPDIIADFNKICRLKQIPDFYAHYLIHYAQKVPTANLDNIFKAQIESIMTGKSHYHKISQLLTKRTEIITNLNNILQILEGFSDINSGKNVAANVKKMINQLLLNCKNLDEVKQVEDEKILLLAKLMDQIRFNAKEIIVNVDLWKQKLNKLEGSDLPSIRKMKVIFPHHGINCVLHFLSDTEHIKKGFLKRQVTFSNKPDPFFEMITKGKRQTNFQRILFGQLQHKTKQFAGYALEIQDQLPEKPLQKEQQKQKIRGKSLYNKNQQKKSSQKVNLMNNKYSTMTDSKMVKSRSLLIANKVYQQKNMKSRISQKLNQNEEKRMENQKRPEKKQNYRFSQQNLFQIDEFEQKNDKNEKDNKVPRLNLQRSSKKMNQVDTPHSVKIGNLLSQSPMGKGNTTERSDNKQKTLPYFKNRKLKKHKQNASIDIAQLNDIKNQKKQIQNQLKQIIREKGKLQILLKKSQQQSNKEQIKLINQLEKSRQRINQLKEMIKQTDSPKKDSSQLKKSKSRGSLIKSRLSDPYEKLKEELQKSQDSIELQKQQLKFQKDEKKYLEKQVKQLNREKLKLERILDRIDQRENGFKSGRKQPPNTQRFQNSEKINTNSKLASYQKQIKQLKNVIKQQKQPRKLLQDSRASIIYNFSFKNNKESIPQVNQLTDLLLREKQQKLYLQKQIKELTKEKLKIEKLFDQSEGKMSKEKNIYQRKLQKYQQTISRLKLEKDQLKTIPQRRGIIGGVGSYLKKGSTENLYKINQQSPKNFSNQRQSFEQLSYPQQSVSVSKIARRTMSKNLNIKNNKKTIQVVYNNKPSRKSLLTEPHMLENQNFEFLRQKDRKMAQISRQKQLLQRKLQSSAINSNLDFKTMSKKLENTQNQINRYKEQMLKQRQRKVQMQQKVRNLRKTIRDEYEVKLEKEKLKFQKQKEQLAAKIEKEKQERYLKQRTLQQQYKFLKEMQKNEIQLIQLLQHQKQEKRKREVMLRQQIAKREELIQIIEIEQIKKGIQQEVRQQMEEREKQLQQQQQNIEIKEQLSLKKKILQGQIDGYKDNITKELQQIQEQNEKLKKLIDRIKNEENKVMETIKINIQNQQEDEQYTNQLRALQLGQQEQNLNQVTEDDENQNGQEDKQRKRIRVDSQQQYERAYQSQFNDTDGDFKHLKPNDSPYKQINKKLSDSKVTLKQENIDNESLIKQLQQKTEKLINLEVKKKKRYQDIQKSPQYKKQEKIQNLVQYYLQHPHNYPQSQRLQYSPKQKRDVVEELYAKKKQVQDFESELMQSQQVRSFVPTINDDPILSHLLNLREAYENEQADSLRRQLFPPIKSQDEFYDRQLSVESDQTPPPITLKQHADVHNKKYQKVKRSLKDKKSSKNFLAINKMRVMLLEQTRKEKERAMIQQESKRKVKMKNFFRKREKQIVDQMNMRQSENQEGQNQHSDRDGSHQHSPRDKSQRKMTEEEKQLGYLSSASKISKKSIKSSKVHSKEKSKEKSLEKQRQKSIKSNSSKAKSKEKSIHSPRDEKKRTQKSKPNQKENLSAQENQFLDAQQFRQIDKKSQNLSNHSLIIKNSPRKEQNIEKIDEQNSEQTEKHNTVDDDNVDSNAGNNSQLAKMRQTVRKRQKLEQQKIQLQEDIQSYQESMRSYISGEEHFKVYQQFIKDQEFSNYIKETFIELPSQEMQKLNNNKTILTDVKQYASNIVLVAKNKLNIQVGIGLFHKDYMTGEDQYICDFLMAHKMTNFLNLIFNFSRFFFKHDQRTNRVQYQFELGLVQDEETLKNFAQFQGKCKRLGEVYVKANSLLTRRYVLRRNLFEEVQNTFQSQGKGIKFDIRVQVHNQVLKQKGPGFINKKDLNHISPTVLLAYYLRQNEERLKIFRQKAQNDLKYRQLLLTALMFEKKEAQLKSITQKTLSKLEIETLFESMSEIFHTPQISQSQVCQMFFEMNHQISLQRTKRCTFQVEDHYENYISFTPQEAVTKIQTSNSSESGYFINLIPKHKLLMLDAQQYLRMSENNSDLNVFFYVKHYIKNIVEVTKQTFPRVFIPEIEQNDWSYLEQASDKIRGSIFLKEEVKIGWASKIGNSVLYQPTHKDLVIRKPLILALLSANIERIVQGTPICAKLIL